MTSQTCNLLLVIILFTIVGELNGQGVIAKQPTYSVVTPTKIRPNQDVVVAATILRLDLSETFTIRAVVRYLVSDKHAEEICADEFTFTRPGSHHLILQTPAQMSPGNYTIRVTGYSDQSLDALIFINETKLFFDSKQISMFIQTNKPYYKQGQSVLIRLIPLYPNTMPVTTSMDVSVKDNNGIVVKQWFSLHTNAGGVVTLKLPLNSNFLAYGTWSINAFCMEHTYTKTFQVIEFYPPLFFVNVSVPTYTLRHSKEFPVLVTSTQGTLYPVKGNGTVTLDFLEFNGKKIAELKPIVKPLDYFYHRQSVSFDMRELEEYAGGPNSLIGKQLKATAVVEDWFFRTKASGYASTIVYSEKIFLTFLGGEVWSFKPKTPFKIYIAAQKLDKSPMDPYIEDRNLELVVTLTAKNNDASTFTEVVQVSRKTSVAEYWLRPTDTTEHITVRATVNGDISTEKTLVATRYWSPTESYLHISSSTERPQVDNYAIFTLETNRFVDIVHYYIISAGNIVVSDSIQMYARSKLFSVAVSREMSPSAKIVAYYITPDGQVAADSLQFHVDNTKLHNMKVKFNRGKDLNYDTIEITAWADPLSYVAFATLEYQMYHLGIRNGLSWEQVNQEMYTYSNHTNTSITHYFKQDGQTIDTFRASTPSYAHDANSTFYFAGLYIFTDANVSAVYTACNMSKGEYSCMDGKSCYTHLQMCDSATACASDHRDEMGCHRNESEAATLFETGGWDRTKHVGAFYRDGAFMWIDQFTKPDGRIDIIFKPPPYEVSWVVSAFALSRQNGLAILPGLNLFNSGRPIYMNVQAAKKMRLGEILVLRVSLFSRWTEEIDVLLSIKSSTDYNFVQIDRNNAAVDAGKPMPGEHQVMVTVRAGGERQLYIPVQPSRAGEMDIVVRAMCFVAGHSVTHHVSVGYDAISDRNITNYQVDLRIANSETLPDLWLPVEEDWQAFEQRWKLYIPGSAKSYVTVIGDIVGISFFPYAKFNLGTGNMIAQPSGTGPEAIFNFAINVYTLGLLRSPGTITYDKILKVVASINIALQEMYAYKNTEGSFREFDWSSRGSTWVSAIALRILTDGVKVKDLREEFSMPQHTLNDTASWLLTKQDSMGRFLENDVVHNRIYSSKMNLTFSNGTTAPANMALTALCLIGLSHASTAASLTNDVVQGIHLGAQYLDNNYVDITDPFEMAIVTYAMFSTGVSQQQHKALSKLKSMQRTAKGMVYWSSEEIPAIELASSQDTTLRLLPKSTGAVTGYAVSATSYALLAYMQSIKKGEERELLDPLQKFLQEQHMWVGGFASSQDTLIAMQALRELADRDQDRKNYEMTFTFRSDQDPDWVKTIHLDQSNWFDLQKFETPSHWGTIQTQVRGHGIALVQLETTQNFENREQIAPPPIPGIFDLGQFNYNISTRGFNHSFIDYKICPRWNGKMSPKSGMAVLEVNLPTGYMLAPWALQNYVAVHNQTTSLRAAEFNSGDGIGVFYFEYLNTTYLNCMQFTAYRWFPAAQMAEYTGIKVYEYYEPGNYFSSMYEKVELLKLTVCLVCGSYQCPYCPYYNTASCLLPNTYLLLVPLLVSFIKHTWS